MLDFIVMQMSKVNPEKGYSPTYNAPSFRSAKVSLKLS